MRSFSCHYRVLFRIGSKRASDAIGGEEKRGSKSRGGESEEDLTRLVEVLRKLVEKLKAENDMLKQSAPSNTKYMHAQKENKKLREEVETLRKQLEEKAAKDR